MNNKQARLQALERQIGRLKRRLDILDDRSNRYSWVRVAIFVVGVALSVVAFLLIGWWLGLVTAVFTLIIFNVVAYYHRKIERSITRHKIWLRIQSTHIARMQLDWGAIPAIHAREPQVDHPFATDLDITGERSLHRLLNTAVSREGTQRLQDWLLQTTPNMQAIHERQALVQELTPMALFRDKLLLKSILASKNVADQWEGKKLLGWLDQQQVSSQSLRSLLLIAVGLSCLTILLFILNYLALIPQFWVISLLLSVGFFFGKRKARGDLFEDAYYLRDAFMQLSTIFEYLETYRYGKNLRLKKLCEPFFRDPKHSPSGLLRRIARVAYAATLEKNQLLWVVINAIVPWDFYVAYRLNHYKSQVMDLLPTWLETWFQVEALCSLATFAYLNPDYVLPQIVPGAAGEDEDSAVLFRARAIGHPLILEESKVVNDFVVDEPGEVVIVTGSNMSGKSTFLRTLGINLCLAYAGGSVNASSLQTSLFRVFTSMKISDSVIEGYSYFYAEVRRLKALLSELESANRFPLFFLIDEIFKGTNNRERRIGSRAYIKALVGRNCVGVISTHDLELVKLADTLPEIQNYHFQEDVVDGQMVFDYLLRSGPCPTTNALKIMQMEGLPIEPFGAEEE